MARHLLARATVLAVILACALAAPGFADVWIQWDGQPAVYLTLISNVPPGAGEANQIWYGEFNNLSLDYPSSLHAIGGGAGPFFDDQYNLINIWIRQSVLNTGQEAWTDFHIDITGDAAPYKKTEWPSTWNVSLTVTGYDYTSDQGRSILPGQSFTDGIVLVAFPDDQGNVSFEITKRASVPEPMTVGALAAGITAIGAGLRLRRGRGRN
jgi:hypothetical protein